MSRVPPDPDAIDTALGALLQRVVDDEPPARTAIEDLYGQADRLRRRRLHRALACGAGAVALALLVGYGLTGIVLHRFGAAAVSDPRSVAATPTTDRVAAAAAGVVAARGYRIDDRTTDQGLGWRRYTLRDDAGVARGVIEIAVYTTPGGLCFPDPARERGCAEPEHTDRGSDYVRYFTAGGEERHSHEVIVRRAADGRAVAVAAVGPPPTAEHDAEADDDAGDDSSGADSSGDDSSGADSSGDDDRGGGAEAPLTMRQVVRIGTDPRLPDAFGANEWCGRPDPSCPALAVPLPGDA